MAKLVVNESESIALREWLAGRAGTPLVTNTVGVVALQRLSARVSRDASAAALVCYDQRMLEAGRGYGLPVASPH